MVRSISACFASKRCRAPQPPPETKLILRVSDQEYGRGVVFRIGVHTRFNKLMLRYCLKRNSDYTTLRFIFNGEVLEARQTPAQLMMKDEDIIDVTTVLPEQGSAST